MEPGRRTGRLRARGSVRKSHEVDALFSRLIPIACFVGSAHGPTDRRDLERHGRLGPAALAIEEFRADALAHKKLDESGLALRFLLTGPDALADAVGESWAAGRVLHTVTELRILVAGIATADITLAELAAGVFARETGHDPATSDDLTPRIFETPFRDRLAHSAVTFARDASGRLVASGPVVDLEHQLEPPKR